MRKYSAGEILDARERRVDYQNYLLEKYKMPLLVARVNYPGLNKNNEMTQNIIEGIETILYDIYQFKTFCKTLIFGAEGPILFMNIKENAASIKKTSIEIEEKHILGRCVDIDIYDESGNGISRTEIGYSMRKCFICDNIAHKCVRSRKHDEKEVVQYIRNKYVEYMESFYGKRS